MNTRAKVEVVFRRKVRAVWLEQGMALAAKGADWTAARPELSKEISADNSGAETIRKVLEHVRRIWFEPPDSCTGLREAALTMLRTDETPAVRTIFTWGMTIAAYPFVGSVAEAMGRLLKLQKEAHRTEIQRRLREQHGDRDFVSRITRYDVSSFLDWGVIIEAKKAGVYSSGPKTQPGKPEHFAWLTEAILISRGKTQVPISELTNHPVIFPIDFDKFNGPMLQKNPRLHVERQSLNQEVVFLNAVASQRPRGRSDLTQL